VSPLEFVDFFCVAVVMEYPCDFLRFVRVSWVVIVSSWALLLTAFNLSLLFSLVRDHLRVDREFVGCFVYALD